MKNRIITFILFLAVLSLIFIDTKNMYLFIIMNICIGFFVYILIKEYVLKKKEEEFIEKKFTVLKQNLLNIDDLMIMILKNEQVVWANENSYEKFPHLKNDRSIDFLKDNANDGLVKYNNRVYKILEQEAGTDVVVLMEYTENYRIQKKLNNIQTIIGHFQIDNLTSLKSTMSEMEYLNFYSAFEKDLYNIFVTNKISFQKLSDDQYYLNFPYTYIQEGIKNRFKELGDLINKFHEQGIEVTTTMGIAYNYPDVDITGKKAKEAFDLALSRGGGQIVIFEDENKIYFGGGISNSEGSNRLRARIIGNTLARIIPQKEVVYLVTHENPDADAIGSILLFYEYLKDFEVEVRVVLDSEESTKKFNLENLEIAKDIIYHYVIDKTKKNILISLDNQSKTIISHPKILEELDEKIIIDHHQTPKEYFRGNLFSWIEPSASSTTELVENILITRDVTISDKEVSTLAILGILTDTNKLKYRTSYQTISTLMNLVEAGGDLNKAFEMLYLEKDQFKLKQEVLSHVEFLNDFAIAEVDHFVESVTLSIVADEMLQVVGIKASLAICTVDVDGETKYSVKLRTTGEINAKNFMEAYGGGGHYKQAAAILSEQKKEEMLQKVKENNI